MKGRNKSWIFLVAFLGYLCVSPGPAGAEAVNAELLQRIADLEKKTARMEELEHEVAELRKLIRTQAPPDAAVQERGNDFIPKKSQEFAEKNLTQKLGGVYTKPFLRRYGRNTYVGGYADMEYLDDEDSNARFRQHRLIPFIYSDVSDRVKFATEIEFEDGGPQNNQDDGEVKIEFATIDYLIKDYLNFRTGIILSPLGKFNLVHDSPVNDLINRPLVDTNVIPTTLAEAGAGFYGGFYTTEMSKLDYELYLVNGFAGIAANGTANISSTTGLRNARGSERNDVNDNPAMVGRLAFSPFLGLETGFSSHVGDYDATGQNYLAIYAWDLTAQKGPFEFLFETAYADIQRNAFAKSRGIPAELWGYYVQGNYHFMPRWLKEKFPSFFTDDSKFTLVSRWDQQDLDGNSSDRFTVGLNFRPTEDTVFKVAHEWNMEDRRLNNTPDNELQFSVATYF